MNIRYILLEWYDSNKRDLPWRNTQNPYKIWISEIILQQTRVNQGIDYYHNFIKKFPTIQSLAHANPDYVLKQWQGLGYYSRARNLHQAAQFIKNTLDGKFPDNYNDLLKLKGVGEYTAAAISSFCFNEVVPVIDGNVKRVVSRLFGIQDEISSKVFISKTKKILIEHIDNQNPGKFNQAIMEFGALQCVPVSPDCEFCPFKLYCFACKNGIVKSLPVKQKKNKSKNRYFYYIVARYNSEVAVCKRQKNDIWKGLYEFPLLEFEKRMSIENILYHEKWKNIFENREIHINSISKTYKHLLSHQNIIARFIEIKINDSSQFHYNNIEWIDKNNFGKLAVSRLIEKYISDTIIIK